MFNESSEDNKLVEEKITVFLDPCSNESFSESISEKLHLKPTVPAKLTKAEEENLLSFSLDGSSQDPSLSSARTSSQPVYSQSSRLNNNNAVYLDPCSNESFSESIIQKLHLKPTAPAKLTKAEEENLLFFSLDGSGQDPSLSSARTSSQPVHNQSSRPVSVLSNGSFFFMSVTQTSNTVFIQDRTKDESPTKNDDTINNNNKG